MRTACNVSTTAGTTALRPGGRPGFRGVTTTATLTAVALLLALLPAPAGAEIPEPDRSPVPGAVPDEEAPIAPPAYEPPLPPEPSHERENGDEPGGAPDEVRAASAGYPLRAGVRGSGLITPDVVLRGQGWGHSVGMSQFGAQALALGGRSAAEILTYYYSGTQVTADTRASTDRIRAGIRVGQTSTPVRALDGTVTWRVCTPATDPARNGRVPASRCASWFEQPQGEQLRVRPLPAAGAATPNGSQTHAGDVTVLVDAAPAGEATAAPIGGLLIERREGEVWQPHRAYVTPDDGRPVSAFPVARADHRATRIEAQSYASPDRVYAHGWRDIHLTADRPTDLLSHRLTIVQDVDSIERYLRGLAEVPSSWPEASLRAQAIAGRTYALRGSRGGLCLCDRLSTAADQVFIGESKVEEPTWGVRWAQAVADTRDQVLTYRDATGTPRLAETYYSSSFGGRSENVEDSWAYYRAYQDPVRLQTHPPASYLRSVADPWSLATEVNGTRIANTRRDWTAAASNQAVVTLVNRERAALGLAPYTRIERIRIGQRTDGGTPLTLLVTGSTSAGTREDMTYRGIRASDGRSLARPIAGANLRMELPLVAGGEANGRISSSQVRSIGFGPFLDDDGSTHEYAITWAAQVGVVRGVDIERFAPQRPVTRAQMATYLVNTFQIPTASLAEPFTDVDADATHRANIEALVAAGVASGFGDGTYGPDRAVTRSQMATFLANTLAWSTSTRGSFRDVPPDDVHGANIEAIAERGVTTGCDVDRYCGGDPVLRGQLTSFLHRVVLDQAGG